MLINHINIKHNGIILQLYIHKFKKYLNNYFENFKNVMNNYYINL